MATKASLRKRVEQLNESLGRPVNGWRTMDGKSVANVGYLQLNVYNPGDGWSRYTLVEIVNEQGGETLRSRCGTAGEMDYILDALFRALVYKEFKRVTA